MDDDDLGIALAAVSARARKEARLDGLALVAAAWDGDQYRIQRIMCMMDEPELTAVLLAEAIAEKLAESGMDRSELTTMQHQAALDE